MIGIDLGTSFSAAARVGAAGRPELIPGRHGKLRTPSVVRVGVGPAGAARRWPAPASRVVPLVKTALGDPTWRFAVPDGPALRAEEVAALIVRQLRCDAQRALGGPVTGAVVTVPACAGDAARQATVNALRIAGLAVRSVLNEPTAAVLAHWLPGTAGTALVCDLGGGTFDATVVRTDDRTVEILASEGDRTLGGIDWDSALMALLNHRFQDAGGPDLLTADDTALELRSKAEVAKQQLSVDEQTVMLLGANGLSRVVQVSRSEFECAAADLLARARELTEHAVAAAGLGWSGLDRLVLVGGATRMGMVRGMLEQLTGRSAERPASPEESVVRGAALRARLVEAVEHGDLPGDLPGAVPAIVEVASHGLGMLVRDVATGTRRNVVVLPANTRLPAERRDVFATVEDNQPRVEIEVTQGDDVDPAAVCRLGRRSVLLPPLPAGAPIGVAYGYDPDQTAYVEVTDLTSDERLARFEVRAAGAMSDREVAESIARLADLDVL
ncbi:MAG TPA: Hsp70 family protein [Mycobacteriales bacterium]|nr:Hsp70 family protein [Mycobacteriales bacterium]